MTNPTTSPAESDNPPPYERAKARIAVSPSLNGAAVIATYQGNVLGREVGVVALIDALEATFTDVKAGDLGALEAMLISQATALQSIFASLARRAAQQEQLHHYEAFLGLALKAQAQSRATIGTLIDLKYPRQATFVKQANIAHGPQQVNNDTAGGATSRAKEDEFQQNKLLEVRNEQPVVRVDVGATRASKRSNPPVEAVVKVDRPQKP